MSGERGKLQIVMDSDEGLEVRHNWSDVTAVFGGGLDIPCRKVMADRGAFLDVLVSAAVQQGVAESLAHVSQQSEETKTSGLVVVSSQTKQAIADTKKARTQAPRSPAKEVRAIASPKAALTPKITPPRPSKTCPRPATGSARR